VQKLVELKQRIKTVSNIQSVTRTLSTVSAAKLSKTRHKAAAMRVYADKMREIVLNQQRQMERLGIAVESLSPLVAEKRVIRTVALVVISGDRGMCGSYNIGAARLARSFIEARGREGKQVLLIVKGRKGLRYLRNERDRVIHAEGWRREGVLDEDVERLLELVGRVFVTQKVDEVYAVYTRFYSPIKRQPSLVRLLPIRREMWGSREEVGAVREGGATGSWTYEPSFRGLMEELVWTYLRLLIFDILIESYASEQGARMITMEEATERAAKSLHEYRVMHNRLRREVITTDLIGVLFAAQVLEETESQREEVAEASRASRE